MPDLAPTERERDLGFAVQTLDYPDTGYELEGLRAPAGGRRMNAVALIVDEACRFRRRFAGGGYVREEFDGANWDAAEVLASLEEVAATDAYGRYRKAREAEAAADNVLETADGDV
jgi:hypothetical protein